MAKMPILWVLKPIFLLFKKACFLYKTSKIVRSRFILTIYDMGIQGVTKVTRGYKGLQGLTRGYRGLQGVTRYDKGRQDVTGGTKDYRILFSN